MSQLCPYCGTDASGFTRCPNCGLDMSAPGGQAGGSPEGTTVGIGSAGPEWGKTVVEPAAPRPDAARRARFDRGREFYEAVDETHAETGGSGAEFNSDHTVIERRHDDAPADDATIIVRAGRRGVAGPLAYIVERSGVRAGKVHLLRTETAIGRGPENDVTLGDDSVSRRHAKIRVEDGKFMYWDLASANNSYLVGADGSRARILEPRELVDGDRIDLGDARVTFLLVDPGEASDAS